MTLSEVLYEAACRMSARSGVKGFWSCCEIDSVVCGCDKASIEADQYASLMGSNEQNLEPWDVSGAADELNWTKKDFRTFMLLMAAEEARVNRL